MKFNKEARDMLRKAVNDEINRLKSTIEHKDKFKRLIVDKDWIDDLLFDKHVDKDGKVYKTIGYTYDNLRYIDLSEVNFENVSFDFRNYGVDQKLSEKEKDEVILNFRGTNARIEFMKTYEVRKYKQLNLSNISFAGVDLSNNNSIDEHGVSVFHNAIVVNCDLTHTGLMIATPEVHFTNSKLYGLDLSKIKMYPDDVSSSFKNCDLRETGLNIKIDDIVSPETIREVVANPMYEGCRAGKAMLKSNQVKGERAAEIYYDFEAWRNAMIDDILYDLNKQVNGVPKTSSSNIMDAIEEKVEETIKEEAVGLTEIAGPSSFYGCDNVSVPKKEDSIGLTEIAGPGSFYGCDNVPEEPTKESRKKGSKKKTLKNEAPKGLNGLEAYINEDIDD